MVRRTREQSSTALPDATTSTTSLPYRESSRSEKSNSSSTSIASSYHPSSLRLATSSQTFDDPNAPPNPKTTVVHTSLLIPGDGEPRKDTSLVVQDGIIVYIGLKSEIPRKFLNAEPKTYTVPVLMPGLWDCHVHFGGEGLEPADWTTFLTTHPASAGARLARGCWETLQRGYTSVRDLAGFGCEIRQAVDDGTIIGPNIYSAGGALSQIAGHGDIFSLPAGEVYSNFGVRNLTPGHYGSKMMCICDGVDEVRRAVRLQIRRGARVIKVFASGGVLSRDDDPKCQQFSDEELRVIVEEAERQNRIVAAHVHGKPGILAAIRAGCKTLEHLSYADEEVMTLMKEKDIVYIGTQTVIKNALDTNGDGIPPQSWKKMKQVAGIAFSAYSLAIKSGVKCALGTDTAPGSNYALELELAVKAGMTELEAIKAATANGPLTLGPQAPEKTGQLKVGYEADMIALEESPLEGNIKALQNKEGITHVWKGGRLFKGPGVGPWGEEE
ncbi:putative amidohydrolase [Phaeomoniella chlamydospora]|uniref:Putative amidohydrolase n=1 Tax=Phaeomoniella chlamydospora TaxID=158046 RepID=A0A0G2HJS2_PHACM|nr:putative amidohydrolase [Phaeomoniella chlamydospora]